MQGLVKVPKGCAPPYRCPVLAGANEDAVKRGEAELRVVGDQQQRQVSTTCSSWPTTQPRCVSG